MKNYLDEEVEEDDEVENLKSYTSLIFNAQSSASKDELLATLPQRSTVDLLVSRYFNSNSFALRKSREVNDRQILNHIQMSYTDQHSRELYVKSINCSQRGIPQAATLFT
jgi:hypothetical protein